MRRVILGLGFVVLLLLAVALALGYLDAALELDHARQQLAYQQQTIRTLYVTLDDVARTVDRDTVIGLIERRAGPGHVIKRYADSILLDDILFVFDGSRVSKVVPVGSREEATERR